MKGQMTIGRRFGNNVDKVYMTLKGKDSRMPVVEVEIGMKEFSEMLTGLSEVDVNITKTPTNEQLKRLGKVCENKTVMVTKPPCTDSKPHQKQYIIYQIDLLEECDGWEIFDDGTRSQQPSEKHKVVLRRWV